ncbi:BatA domain-containing protein [Christiangramia portivictoriae]|uniref:BatA domain-containing protein n=1 Tax=Christiangramia portivictoriae TaxID=326069 RepID=UPI00041148E9|nr:BatA domain-containing protein [Christiangramia portivictoriae]
MQFEHPELLYALFLLLIPILVHLFKLRKFQKEEFTNVKFLKRVVQRTRKSSQLKKFLVLACRLLMLSCLILAFAKPYFPAEARTTSINEVIYLDNSYSMQLKNQSDELLELAKNELLQHLDPSSNYSLITNDAVHVQKSLPELKNIVQNLKYTSNQLDMQSLLLQACQFPEADSSRILLISDFQENLMKNRKIAFPDGGINSIRLTPEITSNIKIDSVHLMNSTTGMYDFEILFSGNYKNDDLVVSMYDDTQLLSRKTFNDENGQFKTDFTIPVQKIANGSIVIQDNGLKYDNILYFSISEKRPIKVLAISERDPDFLRRLYTKPEFDLNISKPNEVDYSQLQQASLIVINEVSNLSEANLNNIKQRSEQGSTVLFIPSAQDATNLNHFARKFDLGFKAEWTNSEQLITGISFSHPLLENVFQKKVQNFEYPRVDGYYSNISGNSILTYQNNDPFLISRSNTYVFTTALNQEMSNFQNSPLIVPVLYQIGMQSLPPAQLYYQTSEVQEISIPVEIEKDRVLHLSREDLDYIPQQQRFDNRVVIRLGSNELRAGNYEIRSNKETLFNLSLNDSRKESELTYLAPEDLTFPNHASIGEYFSEVKAGSENSLLWKWFIIFAIIFLAIEMLLLKLLK